MAARKQFAVGQLFTESELRRARRIGVDHARLRDEVVKPALKRIERVTGQENDPDYLAYVLEWAMAQSRG